MLSTLLQNGLIAVMALITLITLITHMKVLQHTDHRHMNLILH